MEGRIKTGCGLRTDVDSFIGCFIEVVPRRRCVPRNN